VAHCVGFVEDRADDPDPAAEQRRSHDRDVGRLLPVDTPEPHEIGAVGGGWFLFAQPEVHGQFGPGPMR
jgi:hypothetical protein